jgi:hypothetical protein
MVPYANEPVEERPLLPEQVRGVLTHLLSSPVLGNTSFVLR